MKNIKWSNYILFGIGIYCLFMTKHKILGIILLIPTILVGITFILLCVILFIAILQQLF
jgi:hypothetical protein